jgi:hypothetical protein
MKHLSSCFCARNFFFALFRSIPALFTTLCIKLFGVSVNLHFHTKVFASKYCTRKFWFQLSHQSLCFQVSHPKVLFPSFAPQSFVSSFRTKLCLFLNSVVDSTVEDWNLIFPFVSLFLQAPFNEVICSIEWTETLDHRAGRESTDSSNKGVRQSSMFAFADSITDRQKQELA